MQLVVALFAVLACLTAAHFSPPRERRYVWPCAVALAINWVLYISAWLPRDFEPAWIIYHATGAALKTDTVWAITDVITAGWVISVAYKRFWAIALHVLYLDQIAVQIASDANGWGNHIDNALTAIFYLQIACLLAGGWDGICDLVDRACGKLRAIQGKIARRSHYIRHGLGINNLDDTKMHEEREISRIHAALEQLYRID